jgi:hypothetical protein
VIEIQVIGGLYVVQGPKCVLVLDKAEFIRALQAGKRWKRKQALQARQAVEAEAPRRGARRRG